MAFLSVYEGEFCEIYVDNGKAVLNIVFKTRLGIELFSFASNIIDAFSYLRSVHRD